MKFIKHEYDVNVYEDGDEYWYKRDTMCRHRLNGPAVIDGRGAEYFIDDMAYSEWAYKAKIAEMKTPPKPKELTVKQIEELLGYTIKIVKG